MEGRACRDGGERKTTGGVKRVGLEKEFPEAEWKETSRGRRRTVGE